jgi:acyl-coenzyme A synthetase/AMP-(fatty) acid ligase/acyl carrier protein
MLFESFKKIVEFNPEKIAVYTPAESASYKQIDERSDIIARLISDFYQQDVIVFLEPSSDYFASLVACMKSCAIAVPIDYALPDERVLSQISRCGAKVCLSSDRFLSRLQKLLSGTNIRIISLDEQMEAATDTFIKRKATDAACMIHRVFTSGSGGQQTLVTFSQETTFHDANTTAELYGFKAGSKIANIGRYSSSLGINGFWRATLSGSTIAFFDLKKETILEVRKRIHDLEINILQGQPTLLEKLSQYAVKDKKDSTIQHLIIGGEALRKEQLKLITKSFPVLIKITYNYSSTETMLISAFTASPDEIFKLEKIPVGQVALNKTIEIIDENGKPVKKGDTGQIIVRSKFLAEDISGKDASMRFVKPTGKEGIKTYFTGDLGRINEMGLLEHQGRADRQIKIQGIRIDPFEVENAIENFQEIEKCVVVSVEILNRQLLLAAAIVFKSMINDKVLAERLSAFLPQSHIPKVFVGLKQIPVSNHGKTDFNAIRKIIFETVSKSHSDEIVPQSDDSPVKNFILGEWSRILNRKNISTTHSIFQLGADSLSVFDLTARVNEKYNLGLEPSWVIKNPSVDQQVIFLQAVLKEDNLTNYSVENVKRLLGWG